MSQYVSHISEPRHLAMLLNQVEARTKPLITLSDGKPDDYSDNYRGE